MKLTCEKETIGVWDNGVRIGTCWSTPRSWNATCRSVNSDGSTRFVHTTAGKTLKEALTRALGRLADREQTG